MRVLAVLVDFGSLASAWFSQTVIQLLDECLSGAGGKVGKAEEEIILETIMAGLMIATSRLQREVALDYGSILESLKKIFGAREQRLSLKSQALAPVKKPMSKDLLSQLWEGFCAYNENSKKVTLIQSYAQSYQRISEKFQAEISMQTKNVLKGDKLGTSISFVEYIPPNFQTFEAYTKNQTISGHFYSAFYVPIIDFKQDLSKLELAVALDLVSSVLAAFSTSQ